MLYVTHICIYKYFVNILCNRILDKYIMLILYHFFKGKFKNMKFLN